MAESDSIFFTPASIALLVNESAIDDLNIFLTTLTLWNPSSLPTLYIYCTDTVKLWLTIWKEKYSGVIVLKPVIEPYRNLTRAQMESMPSEKGLSNRFHDFTQEKCGLVEWALESIPAQDRAKGLLFCDADILWLGPLPTLSSQYTLALSPHLIRSHDESQFGIYNAGFLWTNSSQMPLFWRDACKRSRFFEQAALEELKSKFENTAVFTFGPEVNYGWWRLYQSPRPIEEQKKRWSIKRDPNSVHSGLCVDEAAVCCIHTHWKTNDSTTNSFNKFISDKLRILKSNPNVAKLIKILNIK